MFRVKSNNHTILNLLAKLKLIFPNKIVLPRADIKKTGNKIFFVLIATTIEIASEMKSRKTITLRSALGLEKNIFGS